MNLRLVNIGFGNMVAADKVLAIVSPSSAPAKRLKDEAKAGGRLIDVTQGRKTRSIVISIANQVILTAVQVETLASRLQINPAPIKKSETLKPNDKKIIT